MNSCYYNSAISFKPEESNRDKGTWYYDKRLDMYEVTDANVLKNSESVSVVWEMEDVIDMENGTVELRVNRFRDTFNLDSLERFSEQPVCAGFSCTGVLVEENIIATAAHFIDETELGKVCFIFGYVMADPETPVTRIPVKNIYYGVEILHSNYNIQGKNAIGSDWALIRLDRNVVGRYIARLSGRPLFIEQSIYSIGHPCGLPLKVAPGGIIERIDRESFTTKLDLYSGTSGSPVFCLETHDLIGIVSACDPIDFKWRGDRCISIVYPDKEIKSNGTRCTKALGFNEFINRQEVI